MSDYDLASDRRWVMIDGPPGVLEIDPEVPVRAIREQDGRAIVFYGLDVPEERLCISPLDAGHYWLHLLPAGLVEETE